MDNVLCTFFNRTDFCPYNSLL